MKQKTGIFFAMTAIVTVATLGAVVLAINQAKWSSADYLGGDVFKLTFQFLLLVVLGGAISIVYKEFSSEQDAARADLERRRVEVQNRREIWKSLSHDLIEIYNNSKRIRRLLRARARKKQVSGSFLDETAKTVLTVEDYDKLVQELNDVQLSFEAQKRLASADPTLETAVPKMVENLGSIERYLNSIILEYEENLPTFSEEYVNLERLNHIREYIGPYSEAVKFKKKYKEPFLEILTALRQAQLSDDV